MHTHKLIPTHVRAPHAVAYMRASHVWHYQIDNVAACSLNDMHITSTTIDCLMGVADRLHCCVKGQHMLCQYDAWNYGLLSFWVHLCWT